MKDSQRAVLAELQQDCVAALTDLSGMSSSLRQENHESEFLRIMSKIAEAVYRCTNDAEGNQQPCDLYFWPGYESIIRPRGKRRIGPLVSYRGKKVPGGYRAHGLFDDGRCSDKIDLTVAAFHDLLVEHGESINGIPFTPGSTHLWAALGPRFRNAEGRGGLIECVHVTTESVTQHDQGVFRIPLDPASPFDWGFELDRRLNRSGEIIAEAYWPVPLKAEPADIDIAARRKLRFLLYSLWLAASLSPDTVRAENSWVDSILEELNPPGMEGLVLRIKDLRSPGWLDLQHLIPTDFHHWYTLIFLPTVDLPFVRESRLLGSAMLFSTSEIDTVLVREIRRTTESIYLSMRYFEAALLSQQQGLQTQAHSFAHDIKKLAGALTGLWVVPLTDLFTTAPDADQSAEGQRKIGTVEIHDPALAVDLGLVPLRSSVVTIGKIMRLWSVLDLDQDFPLLNPAHLNLRTLVEVCWDLVCEAAVVTMLVGEGYNLGDIKELRKAAELKRQLTALVRYCPFEVVGDPPRLNVTGDRAIVLARLLFAILKNALQHGDPLQPVCFFMANPNPDHLELRCTNQFFDWLNDEYPHEPLVKLLSLDTETARRLRALLAKRTFQFEEATSSYILDDQASETSTRSKPFSSRDTIRDCTNLLRGDIKFAGRQSEQYVIEISIPIPGDKHETSDH